MSTINPYLLGKMPSLVDYLNKNGGFSGNLSGSSLSNSNPYADNSGGDTTSLSPQAQALLDQAKKNASQTSSSSSSSDSTAQNDAQKSAQAFLADFFDDNGIDIASASTETLSLFHGLSEIISNMDAPTTNSVIDSASSRASGGTRKSTTLQASGQTVSFVIKYEGGKPASMTVTNVTGSKAETAVIKLGKDTTGKLATVSVNSEINTYNRFGGKTSHAVKDAMNFDLYAADSDASSIA